MQRTTLFIILFLLFIVKISAQKCNCESNFEWVKKTFEANDAGFQYVLETKGAEAYASHNAKFLKQIKATKDLTSCKKLMYEWLQFFRNDHFSIRPIKRVDTVASKPTSATTVTANDKWETLNVDTVAFEQYLNKKKELDYEGIWYVDPYKIGIKKVGSNYIGFIIQSGVESWKQGQVKLRINVENGMVKTISYLKDKTSQESSVAKLIGNSYLQVGGFVLKRISPQVVVESDVEQYIQLTMTPKPYLESLNETTLILRIPSFKSFAKKDIDSIISLNRNKILSTPNLIIDIRNNGGGSDGSYKQLIPLLYTNPIRTVGVAFLSTKLNNQRMLDFINKPELGFDEEDKKGFQKSYNTLEKHLGQFVNLNESIVGIDTLKEIYAYPKNVGILINSGNGSTAEQFLLEAKQSKKSEALRYYNRRRFRHLQYVLRAIALQ
jgi:hypothetical protein